MRKIAALSFLVLTGTALIIKLAQEPRTHYALSQVMQFVPDFQLPTTARVRVESFSTLAMPVPAKDSQPESKPQPPAETQVTLVLAGDTGLNGSFQPVYASFGLKGGSRLSFEEATPAIAPVINGDINFANLETVVTDRNDLPASLKLFGFRTHPKGVQHLLDMGFNVFSTANNHSMDYGLEGARETLKHLTALGVAQAGLGATRAEAQAARVVEAKGLRFAFGAMGIIGSGYASPSKGEARPGQLSPGSERDVNDVVSSLAGAPADFRVLSVHYGTEFEVTSSGADRARFQRALSEGVDLVVGHHQHVVAGVEMVDGKPIFYGMGNFLHWGTQDMGRHDMCHDYGLVARVHLMGKPGEKPSVRAIEAMPVTNMHMATRRLSPKESGARVQAMNYLARQFGARGVRFAVEADGTGLFCAPGSERLTGAIGARCAAGPVVSAPTAALASRIEEACARRVVRVVEENDDAVPAAAQVAAVGAAE